jgi:multidrug resistance protein, MATE family
MKDLPLAINSSLIRETEIGLSPWQAFRKIVGLALPMGASYTFSWSIFLSGIFIDRLQEQGADQTDSLGASTLVTILFNTLGTLSIAVLFSISIYTGNQLGKLRQSNSQAPQTSDAQPADIREKISGVPINGTFIGSGFLLVTMPAMYFSKSLLIALGQNPQTAEIAQRFLRPATNVLPSLMLRLVLEQVMFGFEKQRPPMYIALFNFAIGVFLATSWGFGNCSFPRLGISGLAYGFTIDSLLTCIGFGLFLGLHPDFRDFNFFKRFKRNCEDWEQIKDLLKIGLPIVFTVMNEIVAQLMVSLFTGWLGKDQIAAQNSGSVFTFLALIVLICPGQATCQEISREIGAKNYYNTNLYATYGLVCSMVFMAPLSLIALAAPQLFTNSLANSQAASAGVVVMGKRLMLITALGMPFDSARYNMLQVLRATGDHVMPTVISTSTLWGGVIVAYTLGFMTPLGIYGIALGYALGLIAGCVGLFPRWYQKLKPEALAEKDYRAALLSSRSTLQTPLLTPSSDSEAREGQKSYSCNYRFFNILSKIPAKLASMVYRQKVQTSRELSSFI